MRVELKATPREFDSGAGHVIRDCGSLVLSADEMVTLRQENDKPLEITAKSWGFYLGSSVNHRMKVYGFKTALVLNSDHDKIFVMAVNADRVKEFREYLASHYNQKLLCWLDEWVKSDAGLAG